MSAVGVRPKANTSGWIEGLRALLRGLGTLSVTILGSYRTWFLVGSLWAGLYAFADRQSMNPDGMSYVDLASNAVAGGPAMLINGYWSSGYPALIAVALWLVRPSAGMLYPVIHILNFILFVLVMGSFTFYLKNWFASRVWKPANHQERPYWVAFAFCVFLGCTVEFATASAVTPDLCVMGICFVIAGIICRLQMAKRSTGEFAILGLALAAGYYFKAAMFPLGMLCLASLLVWPPSSHVERKKLLVTAGIFAVAVLPLVILISTHMGHWTIGASGRLNYAWFVNKVPQDIAKINEVATPELIHAPRSVLQNPRVIEFAQPVRSTFPPWFDPSYWFTGVKTKIDLQQQWTEVQSSLFRYGVMLRFMNGFVAGAFLLGVLILRDRKFRCIERRWFWQLVWPFSVALMYTVVYVEARYVAVFWILFWMGVYGVLTERVKPQIARVILLASAVVVIIPNLMLAAVVARQATEEWRAGALDSNVKVAEVLQSLSVMPGDRVAVVGDGSEAFYAQLAHVRIVAELPNAEEFRKLSGTQALALEKVFQEMGIKVLVFGDPASQELRPVAGLGEHHEVTGASGTTFHIYKF